MAQWLPGYIVRAFARRKAHNMNNKRNALIKGLTAIAAVIIICISISRITGIGSETLGDIAREHPQPTGTPRPTATPETGDAAGPAGTPGQGNTAGPTDTPDQGDAAGPAGTPGQGDSAGPADTQGISGNVPVSEEKAYDTENPKTDGTENDMKTDNLQNLTETVGSATLTGLSLNQDLMADARTTWAEGFYHEPLSDGLAEYITGVSYPEDLEDPAIFTHNLSYVHVFYIDFEGNPAEGELICNQKIAQDLVEIFHELYLAEYRIEKIRLIDEYNGNDDQSMEDNNTSCFNYRVVSGSSNLSRHAYGLAVDVNPLYNPYITYNRDHSINVAPAAGEEYADRSKAFPYKIDENDLCCRLFKEHGFTWGGDWNSCKDYQHFQKTP